jgi:hypothetical protein
MLARNKLVLLSAIIICLGFWLIYMVINLIAVVPSKKIIAPVSMIENRPAGEIVSGLEIVQSLQLYEKEAELIRKLEETQGKLCINLFLANYADRPNEGSIKLTLQQKEIVLEGIIDMSSVKNNSFHKICFSSEDFSKISAGELLIKLAGLEGKQGSSITAWLTSDLKQGVAFINGVNTGKALRFSLTIEENSIIINYSVIALLLVYLALLLVVGLLLVAGNVKDSAREYRR